MKTKNILQTITGIFLLSLCSCSDFLEPKSQSEYIPKDANALQEMLIGGAYPKHNGEYILTFMDFFSDDIQFHKTDYEFDSNSPNETEARKALFTWQPDMFITIEKNDATLSTNIWEAYYTLILGANAALDYIEAVSGTENEKNFVIAQALTLRGFYYFMLVNHFGAPYNYDKKALGVPMKLNSKLLPEEELLLTRNTVEEVYNQILTDLNEAERLFRTLPKDKQYKTDYLVNLPMIELLKSRIYLYMENWKEAKIYANKVIKDWSFSLVDLNSLPTPSKAEPYYNFTSHNSPEVIWLYGRLSDLTAFFNVTVTKEEYSDWGKETYYRNAFIASDALMNSFTQGDLRKEEYIAKEYDRENRAFYKNSYSPFGKYKLSATGNPSGAENFALSFRLSEAYLNLAEAAAHDHDESTAISTLNALLKKRYTPGEIFNINNIEGQNLLDFILEERRKELCFEGQRWLDLRRNGMPQITHSWLDKTYTLKKNDLSYTMPIPEYVSRKNGNIVQNPLAPKRDN